MKPEKSTKPLAIIHGMAQAITTKYHGPGNVRGARISATTESGIRITVPYDHAGTHDDRHAGAARALCDKMGWSGVLVSGGTKNGNVFVFLPVHDAESIMLALREQVAATEDTHATKAAPTKERAFIEQVARLDPDSRDDDDSAALASLILTARAILDGGR